jgi:hypothetical protein
MFEEELRDAAADVAATDQTDTERFRIYMKSARPARCQPPCLWASERIAKSVSGSSHYAGWAKKRATDLGSHMNLDNTEKSLSIRASIVTVSTPIVAGIAWLVTSCGAASSPQIAQATPQIDHSQPGQPPQVAPQVESPQPGWFERTGVQAVLLVVNIAFALLMILTVLGREDLIERQIERVPIGEFFVGILVWVNWFATPLFLLTEGAVWLQFGWRYTGQYTTLSVLGVFVLGVVLVATHATSKKRILGTKEVSHDD